MNEQISNSDGTRLLSPEITKIVRLLSFVIDEMNWLDECPFSDGQPFYEVAERTLRTQKQELEQLLQEHGDEGAIIAERIREMQEPDFEFPEGHNEVNMLEEIRLDIENLA